MGKLAITKAKTVVTVNTYSRACSRARNSPTKYSLKVVVHAALGPREAMWCGGGDEMWGVSGQGSLEDEWGWRGQTEQLEHLFSFWFPIGLSFILIVTDLFGNEGSIRKLDFYFFYNTDNIILHREEEKKRAIYCTYLGQLIVQVSLDKHRLCDLLFITAWWLLTYIFSMHESPGNQIRSVSNYRVNGVKCQYGWPTKHTVDIALSWISVWGICPHSDSGHKICPFSNETLIWTLPKYFGEHIIWIGLSVRARLCHRLFFQLRTIELIVLVQGRRMTRSVPHRSGQHLLTSHSKLYVAP